MKRISILALSAVMLLTSCVNYEATDVLKETEYTVVDTLNISRNGFDQILGYDVIVLNHYDSSYHYGYLSSDPMDQDKLHLREMNPRPIKMKK